MHLYLLVVGFVFLTLAAAQINIDSDSSDFADNDFIADSLIDDLDDSNTGDLIAANSCRRKSISDTSINPDTALDLAWVDTDSPVISRRFQVPEKSPDLLTCPQGEDDSEVKLPEWAERCGAAGYGYELCCTGKPFRTTMHKRKRQSVDASFNVKGCSSSTSYLSFSGIPGG